MYTLIFLTSLGMIIVGKRWPPPRWFIADNAPPGFDQVIADGDTVVADGDDVIVPE